MARFSQPTRRNRNIGTAKQGFGQDNELSIPNGCDWNYEWQAYWEKLGEYVVIPAELRGQKIQLVVERPQDGFYYPVTPWDVIRLLDHVDSNIWSGVELFVWRQPTKIERSLTASWGRIAYYATIKEKEIEGTAIFLHALPRDRLSFSWNKSLTPEDRKEMDRYREAGIDIRLEKRRYAFKTSPEADRYLQLFHTIPHELGHYDDYQRHARYFLHSESEFDESREENERRILEGTPHYDLKPAHEKEVYAHNFSDRLREELKSSGAIPYPLQFNATQADTYEVDRDWFSSVEDREKVGDAP